MDIILVHQDARVAVWDYVQDAPAVALLDVQVVVKEVVRTVVRVVVLAVAPNVNLRVTVSAWVVLTPYRKAVANVQIVAQILVGEELSTDA